MKKYFIIAMAIILMAFNAYAFDVIATWDHDGENVDGFVIFWKQSGTPDWQWNKKVENGAARQLVLAPEEAFEPGVEYSFVGIAYNSIGYSADSDIATWMRDGGSFTPPDDKLPSVLYLQPVGIDQIQINLNE